MLIVRLFEWVKSPTKNQLANVVCSQLLIHSKLTETVHKQTQQERGVEGTRKVSF